MLAWRLQRSWIDRSQLGDLSAGRKVQNFKWANSWFTSWVRYQCGQTLLPIGRPFGKPTRIAFHLRLLGTKSKTRRLRSALPIVKARIWQPELIEPAVECKRRARGWQTFKSADSDPKILPQCNISSNYPYNVWVFWVSRHRSIILDLEKWKHFRADFEKFQEMWKLEWSKTLVDTKTPWFSTKQSLESLPEVLTGEPNTNKKKTATKRQFITL